MAQIHIQDLKLRSIIGINDWERDKKQDIIINIHITFNAEKAINSDNIKDTIDYKAITKRVIKLAESSKFFLLERMCAAIMDIVFDDKRVEEATVKIDKPHALRFADSVSFRLTRKK
ncbi:MAG: dihydroneopterin aldolase [Candidatus Omnitrophica bacterium]|nr:dihydroneopterin aldolase [Candidatus Omnitrophota bacterium]